MSDEPKGGLLPSANEELLALLTGDPMEDLRKQTQAGYVMVVTSTIDNILVEILQLSMPSAGKDFLKKLFSDRGPLGTFSSRIDLAFALGLATPHEYTCLHAIRRIRNKFAHTSEHLSFKSPVIVKLVNNLPIKNKPDAYVTFLECCLETMTSLTGTLKTKRLVEAVRTYAGSSNDKS